MAVVERFNYIEYSDSTKFYGDTTGRIELAGYPSELMLYSSFDSVTNATYAISDENAVTGDTVTIENFGVFGQHAWIQNTGYVRYNSNNFETLTTDGSIKFRMRPGFNNAPGYQNFSTTTAPSIPVGGDSYYFKLYIDGSLFGDTHVELSAGDSLTEISDTLNLTIATSTASAAVTSSKIRVTADTEGDSISIEAPASGNSLITLLTSVETAAIPNAPSQDIEFISFYNGSGDTNRVSIIHDTDSHIIVRIYDDDGDTQVNEDFGEWSNHYLNWYAFELNWNESITQLFINGTQFGVTSTGFERDNDTFLFLQSGDTNSYRFDELIVYNEYQNTKDYTVETADLSQYDDNDPYVDINFGDGFVDGEITDLNLIAHANTRYVVKIGNTWYYYLSGAWRVSDGTFSQSVTPSIMETQFPSLTFNESADLIVRVYFSSDGETLVWLDEIEIVIETGAAETAIITGSVDLTTAVDLSSVYNVVITTDQGSMEVDVSDGAGDSTAVTLAEIKAAIDGDSVPGLADASDDGSGHLVLQTTSTGEDASITIDSGTTNDALSTIWGFEATDAGAAAVGDVTDYSELFRYVRGKLGEPLIPAEITDEQLEDCLADATFHYNRWRNFEEKILYTSLTGTATNGYDIPATVGGAENILEIIMRPRFPFTYYAGRTDLITNLYVQYLFQKYKSGFSSVLTDYYVTVVVEEDINVILGTQIKWEILNDKLWIWPEPDSFNVAIKYRGALTASEVVTNYWIRRFVLAEAKIVLGTIRGTFTSGIPGGAELITLNYTQLLEEGAREKAELIEEMKKSQEPMFLEFF